MNCHLAQKKINDSFAAGAAALPVEVAAHRETCAACQEFFATRQRLFRTLDAGLQSLVNAPVPPSFLPRVRARLDEVRAPTGSFNSGWSLLALAAVVLLALGVPVSWHHPERRTGARDPRSAAFRAEEQAIPTTAAASPRTKVILSRTRRRAAVLPSRREAFRPSLEVFALPEERAAFARFVAEIPEKRNLALALTHAAPVPANETQEIALLEIAALEVKPLDGTAAE